MKKLVIFETNNKDGIMSRSKKFYPDTYSEEDIKQDFLKTRQKEVDLSSDGTKLYKAGTKIISQTIKRNVKYHNLDAAFSVDYRVNSYRVFNLDEGQ